MQQGTFNIPGFWRYGAHPPVLTRLTRVVHDNLASLAACRFHKLSNVKPGCPWLGSFQIVTVIGVDGNRARLTRGFRVVLEGFEQVLFEFLHLLESFLFQVAERSTTCSSTPCGCNTAASIPPRGGAAIALSRHRRRRAARSASPFLRRARRLCQIPSARRQWSELMTMMFLLLGPIGCYFGLPTQVQDLHTLLL